jgi:hypothetical protein
MYQRLMALEPAEDSAGVLTQTQATDLTDSGSSDLHYHSSDRARANHTGTQPSSTISDFTAAVQAVSSSANHATLNNLSWLVSGHTGTLNTIPAFSSAGAAIELTKTGTGTVVVMQASPTFTGVPIVPELDVNGAGGFKRTVNNSFLSLYGGVSIGAVLQLYGTTHANAGLFSLIASDGSSSAVLTGTAAGTLTWSGAALSISSTSVTWAGNPTHSGNHVFSGNVTTQGLTILGNGDNVGIGVTPSAATTFPLVQALNGTTFGSAGTVLNVINNGYFDGSWRYVTSDTAGRYTTFGDAHIFYTAVSGTAGNALTWVEMARINASGLEIVGNLTVNGNATLGNASTDTLNVGNGGIIKDASNLTGFGVTPTHRLTAQAVAATDPAMTLMGSGSTNHRIYFTYNSTSGYGSIRAANEGTGNVELKLQESGGNVSFGAQMLGSDGSAAAPSYSFSTSGRQDNGMYLDGGADALGFACGGSKVFGLTTGGADVTGALTVSNNTTGTGFIKSTGATAGVGYASGAGGTQTQLTSKATTVELNKVCGEITMHNANLGAATIVSFTLTNSAIAATDVLVLNHVTTGTRGAYTLNAQCAAGSAVIYVRNNTAGILGEAIVIRFAVIKAVTS